MRRLILGGLGLLLGCLVAPASGEQVPWRPQSTPTTTTSPGRPVTLTRPEPIAPGTSSRVDSAVQPASFTPDITLLRPLFHARTSETLRPLPQGPNSTLAVPISQATEVAPPPAPLPQPQPIGPPRLEAAPPHQVWGGVAPHPGAAYPAPPLTAHHGGCGCEPSGGCCDPCGDCCTSCDSCGCWGNAFNQCGCDGGLPHVWLRGEYLLWGLRKPNLPPLVTVDPRLASPAGGTDLNTYLTLDNPNTRIAFGNGPLDLGVFSGGRFTIGVGGLGGELGFEATMFFLGEQTERFSIASDGGGRPGIGLPFFDDSLGRNGGVAVSAPNAAGTGALQTGSVDIAYTSRLWGIEGTLRRPWHDDGCCKLDLIGGFRYINFTEGLVQIENTTLMVNVPAGPPTPANPGGSVDGRPYFVGDTLRIVDSFGVINHFYGGQIGLDFEYRHDNWLFGVVGKLGLGNMHQVVNIQGAARFSGPGRTPEDIVGGIRALSGSNIGHFTRDRVCFVPELGLKVGYQITDSLSAFVGYNVLYMSSVVRAGDQIDSTITGNHIPARNTFGSSFGDLVPPNRPRVPFKATGLWASGVNAGLEWKY